MPKTWLGWAALIIVLILIFKDPAGAGHTVKHWWDSAGTFITSAVG